MCLLNNPAFTALLGAVIGALVTGAVQCAILVFTIRHQRKLQEREIITKLAFAHYEFQTKIAAASPPGQNFVVRPIGYFIAYYSRMIGVYGEPYISDSQMAETMRAAADFAERVERAAMPPKTNDA